jgi:FtsH-binding integral membrane protein
VASEGSKSIWQWTRGLVALGLLIATIVVAFVVNASTNAPPSHVAMLALLMAAFLAWLFWLPPQKVDRYWMFWSLMIVVLLAGGVWLLVNP